MRILKQISEPGLFLQVEGPEEGGVAGIQIDNVYVEASKLRRAWEEFREVDYQESPFESFAGAANVAMALEGYTHHDGTRLVTILSVRRSGESGYYGVEVNVTNDPDGLPNVRTLWRNRDVRDLRTFLDELRYTPREKRPANEQR